MKIIISLLIACSLTSISFSQTKVKIDKITGDTSLIADFEKLYTKPSFSGTVGELLQVSARKSKDANSICFSIRTGKTSVFIIREGDKAFIKLKNDKVITLSPITTTVSDIEEISYGGSNLGIYSITNPDIELLKDNEVKFIRISTSDGFFEYDIKDKFATVLQKVVQSVF